MIYGRTNELQYLNTVYAGPGSQLLVVYGQKHVGKTVLLKEFAKDKAAFYYFAVPASPRQQLFLLGSLLREKNEDIREYPEYDEVLKTLHDGMEPGQKKVFIFDEWEHLIKSDSSFIETIVKLLHHAYSTDDVLIILCSSSIEFVENGMVSKIGKAAYEISGFLKIKELKFVDLIRRFPSYTMEDCVRLYSILGGFPGIWDYFDPALSLKENICQNILAKGCFLQEEGGRLVKEELRETAVYNSILSALADGKQKLNELYVHTGFSRAKISVYLKNLMGLDVVEKVFSIDTPGNTNLKKGMYCISNAYVHFWFKYIYPNYGACMSMSPEAFYERYIEPDFDHYCEEYFSIVCREYMMLSASKDALLFKPEKTGLFDGKNGKIDFVGQNKEGRTIVAFSDFSLPVITYKDYKEKLTVISQAGLTPDRIYLFANGRFDEQLRLEAEAKDNVILIGMEDL